MTDTALAQTSNLLFTVALFTYLGAMISLFFGLAFTKVQADGVEASTVAGSRARTLGMVLLTGGFAIHLISWLSRGIATGRFPLGNMYEYGSGMALLAVGTGLFLIRRKYPNLLAFVTVGAILMMVTSLLLFAEAGPLLPALESYWLQIHVSAMMFSSSVFIVAFTFTVLYLVKDRAERKVSMTDTFGGSTVGAAHLAPPDARAE